MPILNFDAFAVNIDGAIIGSELVLDAAKTDALLKNEDISVEQKIAVFQDLVNKTSKPKSLKSHIGEWLYLNFDDEAAFINGMPNPNVLSGDEKFERANLAFKLQKGGDQDFCKDEIALMKKVVDKRAGIAFIFQFRNCLSSCGTTSSCITEP